MVVIEEYDESLFIQRFENHNQVVKDGNDNGNFTYRGLRALFEYLDELGTEENPIKLDVISLCCDYCEYKNIEAYEKDYPLLASNEDERYNEIVEEEINNNTTLIKFGEDLNEGFIIGTY